LKTLSIHNWDKWQSYRRDRGQPPWIKVHREIMRKVEWVGMTDAQRGQLVAIWLLAADRDGVIPASPEIIQKLCFLDSPPDMQFFIDQGFIDDDDNVASGWRQGGVEATNQNRDRDRIETEAEERKNAASAPQSGKPDRSDEIRNVFEYWQQVHEHPKAKLDDKRKRNIRARLKDGYTVSDLQAAIDGCRKSPHHMGATNGAKYDDIELICRDAKHVDQFLKLAQGPDLTRMSESARKTANAAQEWLDNG